MSVSARWGETAARDDLTWGHRAPTKSAALMLVVDASTPSPSAMFIHPIVSAQSNPPVQRLGTVFRILCKNSNTECFKRHLKPFSVSDVLALQWLVFTALHGMQTRSSDENSVRPSNACTVTKRKNRSVQIYIPYERSFSLVFWEEWLVGATPSTWNFGSVCYCNVCNVLVTLLKVASVDII